MFLRIECGKYLDENKFYRKVKNRCKDCLNKKFICELCANFFTEKWLTTHIERAPRQNESISNELEKPEIGNVNNNNRTLLVRPSFSGKTYLIFKFPSRIPDRDNCIITKSPPGQYSNSKIKTKEIGEDIKPLNEYESAIIVSDDILGFSKSRYVDPFSLEDDTTN